MKILILDSDSMVGHVVALFLEEHGHDVTGYSARPTGIVKTVVGNLHDTAKIAALLNGDEYDAIINCSAIVNQDAENDKAEAAFVNTYLPHYLEKITEGTNTVVVHRSTDCIFSGEKGNYKLSDIPDAISFYARTKAVGEIDNDKDITVRTSLIGPERERDGNGLFNWFYNQTGEVNGFANAIWTGLTTIEFSREIEMLLEMKAHGVFQLVPDYSIGKYELLLMFDKQFPAERRIIKVNNKRVDKSLIQETNGYPVVIPSYETMIAEMCSWIQNHKELYIYYC